MKSGSEGQFSMYEIEADINGQSFFIVNVFYGIEKN